MIKSLSRTYLITFILMACILASAVFLFFPQSLRLDESQTLWQINRFPGGILHAVASDVHVPLYHFIAYAWEIFFGNGVAANRTLSLIFYIISLPFVIILGKEVYGSRKIGIFAGILFVISPYMNWYGSEIRMYTLLVFVTLINQYFFMRARKTNSTSMWIGYAISSIVGMYVHYFFVFVLLTQALFYFMYRSSFPQHALKKLLITAGLVTAALTPWLIYVFKLGQIANSEPLLPRPTLINIFNTFSEFLFGNQSVPLNSFIIALWPLIMLAWFFSLQKKPSNRTPENMYMFLSVMVPLVITFVVSILYKPIYEERYLIFTLPAFYILISATIMSYSPRISRILQFAAVATMLSMLFIEAISPLTPTKENYQAAANYFNNYADPQDVIVVSAPFTIYPIQYYYSGPTAVKTLPMWDQSSKGPIPPFIPQDLSSQASEITADHQRLWLLLSYDQGYEQNIKSYFDTKYQQLGNYELSPGMDLIVYKLRYDGAPLTKVPPSVALN